MNTNYKRLRVLFLAVEQEKWAVGRTQSYVICAGLEDALRANGASVITLNSFCLRRVRELCAGKRFDQIWVHVSPGNKLDDRAWEWVANLAPVRVGLIHESLQYNDAELKWKPWYTCLQGHLDSRKKYLTHVIAVDEADAAAIDGGDGLRAAWWPQAVPSRFIPSRLPRPRCNMAFFAGNPYDERKNWLARPDLQGLLAQLPPAEKGTVYPFLFDALQTNLMRYMNRPWLPQAAAVVGVYSIFWRAVRRRCFELWLRALQTGSAVVNLPHYVKTYASRVVESMAAGRPVVSWEIPDRPRNLALFEHDRDILLYSRNDPQQLAEQIRRVLTDRGLAEKLVRNARQKVLRFHTLEYRVRQFLDWLTIGVEPVFS